MFTLKIKTGNAATEDAYDLGELVHEVAEALKQYHHNGTKEPVPIYDYNGNKVGFWEYEK